jgi:uncharacterized beta-barrel protein YwiB (DUF1934 family)
MFFRERERNTFPYNTPYGTATMGLCTQKIIQNVGEHGGFVSIDYVVDIEYTVVTRNKFQLTITELNQIGEQKNV